MGFSLKTGAVTFCCFRIAILSFHEKNSGHYSRVPGKKSWTIYSFASGPERNARTVRLKVCFAQIGHYLKLVRRQSLVPDDLWQVMCAQSISDLRRTAPRCSNSWPFQPTKWNGAKGSTSAKIHLCCSRSKPNHRAIWLSLNVLPKKYSLMRKTVSYGIYRRLKIFSEPIL